jgi:hypothetical protein
MRLIPLLFLAAALPVAAAEVDDSKTGKKPNDKTPTMVSVDDDPQAAMKKMAVAPGFKLDLYASEPSLRNAVSFAFDEKGRCYVVETHRRRTSVFDIRNYRDWTDADLSFRSVEDRIKFLKENVSQDNTYYMNSRASSKQGRMEDFNEDGRIDWKDLEVESERIQVLMDLTGDFKADQAVTLATGFNTLVSGVAAGVLARNGEIYFTSIPDVWKITSDAFRDQNVIPDFPFPAKPNVPNKDFKMTKLHGGFGVHIAYGGHDMHGLKFGPDGKLYWTIADRGFTPPADIKGAGFSNAFLRRVLTDSGAVQRSLLRGRFPRRRALLQGRTVWRGLHRVQLQRIPDGQQAREHGGQTPLEPLSDRRGLRARWRHLRARLGLRLGKDRQRPHLPSA